jgi:hypothetical protein
MRAKASARAVEKAMAEQKSKAISKAKALGVGGLILILGLGIMIFGTTEAVAPVKAEALVTKKQVNIQTLDKYRNADTLTDTQLVELLKAVGFEGKALREAWAVAKKESNGRPLAYNGNRDTGDNSYGIFQVNMIGQLGVDRRAKFNLNSNAELLSPVVNAKIAYHMSNKGQNWRAWKGMTPATRAWLSKFPYSNSQAIAEARAKAKAKAIAEAKAKARAKAGA